MGEPNEGSIEGRGREELLPERGDPFLQPESETPKTPRDESASVSPEGLERVRAQADPYAPLLKNDFETSEATIGPPQDGGMRAVGPLIEEDLLDEGVPPTEVEMKTPSYSNSEVDRSPSPEGIGRSAHRIREYKKQPQKNISEEKAGERILVSDLRVRRLHERVDQLDSRLNEEVENLHLRRLLLRRIDSIRGQSFAHRDQFEEAERALGEIEDRIRLQIRIQRWSKSLPTRLLVYELVMGMIMIAGLILLPILFNRMGWDIVPDRTTGSLNNLLSMLNTLIWGGLGGVTSALIGIWTHRALDRSLDRQWAIWYVVNPWMGFVLGALLFLFVRASILGVFPSAGNGSTFVWLLYLLGWLAGFKQNIVYDLVERISHGFESKGKKKSR